ncbi:hypothetical protein SLA2020_387990 [Shorea laevis]
MESPYLLEVQKNTAGVNLGGQYISAPPYTMKTMMLMMMMMGVKTLWLQMPLPVQATMNFHAERVREVAAWVDILSSMQKMKPIASIPTQKRSHTNRSSRKKMKQESKKKKEYNQCTGQKVLQAKFQVEPSQENQDDAQRRVVCAVCSFFFRLLQRTTASFCIPQSFSGD